MRPDRNQANCIGLPAICAVTAGIAQEAQRSARVQRRSANGDSDTTLGGSKPWSIAWIQENDANGWLAERRAYWFTTRDWADQVAQ